MQQSLFFAILVQSLVLALLCFTTSPHNKINRWLGLLFVTIAYQRLFQIILGSTSILHQYPGLIISFEVSVISGLFAIQMYILKTLHKPVKQATVLYVAVIAVLLVLFYSGFVNGTWPGVKEYYHSNMFTYINLVIPVFSFYTIYCCLKLVGLSLKNEMVESSQTRFALNAVKWLLYYWTLRISMALVFLPIRITTRQNQLLLAQLENAYLLIVNIVLIILLAVTAYFSLRNPVFFNQPITSETVPTTEQKILLAVLPVSEAKILKTVLSVTDAEKLMKVINEYMDLIKPWLSPKLNLSKLAEAVNIPSYKISKAVKMTGWQNISDFINNFRVEYAKTLLINPDHERDTMYAIALNSGFASEAPFYAAFKKATGLSPSAWRDKQKFS
jgi:AraC-like DNA-binding protein